MNCSPIIGCPDPSDNQLFSLEDPPLASVKCPQGPQSDTVTLVCCGHALSANLVGMSPSQRTNTINDLINQCLRSLAFCRVDTCDNDNDAGDPSEGTALDPCNFQFFGNNPVTASVTCQDGSAYSVTTPGCSILAPSQSDADLLAKLKAAQMAAQNPICLDNIPPCACAGIPYSATLINTGSNQALTWSVSGFVPAGLTVHVGTSTSLLIDGTPTTPGLYAFSITARNPQGGVTTKQFLLSVIGIVTTMLPGFTIGTPYSYQMLAAGGSGHYSWNITSGTLPDGLTMTSGGLITGTPTSAGTNPIIFNVSDTSCETLSPSTFPPQRKLTTVSVTKIATVFGYPEYSTPANTPPKKYHKVTYAGTAMQTATVVLDGSPISSAKYMYSGTGIIDTHGDKIQNYSKDLYVACPATTNFPIIDSFPRYGISTLVGYCYVPDPASCPSCDYAPPTIKGNDSINTATDFPINMIGGAGFSSADQVEPRENVITSSTTVENHYSNTVSVALKHGGAGGVNNVPLSLVNNEVAPWLNVTALHDYTVTLSEEYTDAEALNNALVLTSNSPTAENLPRTTGYESRFTTVTYTVSLTNLLDGRTYTVTVHFRDNNFVPSSTQLTVIASGTTASVSGVVPTPNPGGTITVLSASVALS